MNRTLFCLLALLPSSLMFSQTLTGNWNGSISVGAKSVPIVLHLLEENGKHKCLLDSPDQGARGIEAILDYLDKDSLAFRVPAISASYSGKIKEGQLRGTFSQAGFQFALNLKPGNFVRERRQTPKQPLAYPTEEVIFENKKDHALLSGTISYPVSSLLQKNVPAVLLVTGSGQQNRDEEVMGHKPFAVLADYLAKMGIASLRYDDRGFGQSTGETREATSYTFMSDALAGIAYLKSTGKFGKIGIIGHSEGGMIAFMAAAENPDNVDFVVSLAGTCVKGDSIIVKQNEVLLSANPATAQYSRDYCKVLAKVLQHWSEQQSVDCPGEIIAQYEKEVGANLPEPAVQNLQLILTSSSPWLKCFVGYNPVDAISRTYCPVLAINGEKDTQVDAAMNLSALRQYLPANANHQIKSYPGLNHLFQHCSTGLVHEYGTIEETISPEVLEDIARWINSLK